MEVVNPFILKNKERMILFLDQLSNISDPTQLQSNMDSSNNQYSNSGKFNFTFMLNILIYKCRS